MLYNKRTSPSGSYNNYVYTYMCMYVLYAPNNNTKIHKANIDKN